MNSTDIEVVNHLVDWLTLKQPAYLVTVVETWGSSPRPAGSLLAVNGDGSQVGSVSGGCIEEHLIARITAGEIASQRPETILYGVTREEGERFGLPCGGEIKLVVEKLDDLSEWQQLQTSLADRKLLCRESTLSDGSHRLTSSIPDRSCELTSKQLNRVYGPRWQLIVVGAVDLSLAVAKVAMGLDYQVVICDPRPEFAGNWNLPGTELSSEMPDDLIRSRGIDDHCAIVTLTHDPRYDDMALMEALETDAFYVGSLGSDRTHKARLKRLVELGVPDQAIARLRGPIGLPIGSHTPNEIAIAIAAELIAVRNNAELGARNFKPVMASSNPPKTQVAIG